MFIHGLSLAEANLIGSQGLFFTSSEDFNQTRKSFQQDNICHRLKKQKNKNKNTLIRMKMSRTQVWNV